MHSRQIKQNLEIFGDWVGLWVLRLEEKLLKNLN
jgi:hypothetical protein